MKAVASAGISGLLFGAGLHVGQMTMPAKVIGFLDFFGRWDPSLAWVMVGAIAVHVPLRLLATRRGRPSFANQFSLLPRKRIDKSLIFGAALFGIGWGASGYCPAPAIASSGTALSGLVAIASMLIGFIVYDWRTARASTSGASGSSG